MRLLQTNEQARATSATHVREARTWEFWPRTSKDETHSSRRRGLQFAFAMLEAYMPNAYAAIVERGGDIDAPTHEDGDNEFALE